MSLEFNCPYLNRTVNESECLDVFHNKPDALCKSCTTFEKQCATWLFEKLTEKLGNNSNITLTDENNEHLVEINIGEFLTLFASIHGLDEGTGFVRVSCSVFGDSILCSPIEDLISLICDTVNGKMLAVSKMSLNSLRPVVTLYEKQLLEEQPRKALRGFNVHIIDKNGFRTKKEFLEQNDSGEIK